MATDGGLRFVRPVIAAAGLAATDGGAAIDRLLMRDPSAGDDLAAVADWFERRTGNASRRRVLADVRRRPWSGLERELHRLLRTARIGGWQANAEVPTPAGNCIPDVLFDAARLVLEVDSWEYHGSRSAFELDRRRQNSLVLAGYRVLRFTGDMLDGDPAGVVRIVKRAVGTGSRAPGRTVVSTSARAFPATG